jgi:hypothetical protein
MITTQKQLDQTKAELEELTRLLWSANMTLVVNRAILREIGLLTSWIIEYGDTHI